MQNPMYHNTYSQRRYTSVILHNKYCMLYNSTTQLFAVSFGGHSMSVCLFSPEMVPLFLLSLQLPTYAHAWACQSFLMFAPPFC